MNRLFRRLTLRRLNIVWVGWTTCPSAVGHFIRQSGLYQSMFAFLLFPSTSAAVIRSPWLIGCETTMNSISDCEWFIIWCGIPGGTSIPWNALISYLSPSTSSVAIPDRTKKNCRDLLENAVLQTCQMAFSHVSRSNSRSSLSANRHRLRPKYNVRRSAYWWPQSTLPFIRGIMFEGLGDEGRWC